MPRKIVTNKSDIPSWYQRRITDFENLTENEALFEYESLKLRERARKQAKRLEIDYTPEKIERPDFVIEADIKYLQNIEASDVKQAIESQAPLVSENAPMYINQGVSDYDDMWVETPDDMDEYGNAKEERTDDYEPEEWFDNQDTISSQDYEDDWFSYDNYDYSGDEEEEPEQETYTTDEQLPDPLEPREGESPEEYMERTGQIIDPETGAFIPIADFNDKTEQFIDEVIEYTKSYTADRLEIAEYSSKTGRRKSASNYQWQQNNILRAMNKILSRLEEIRTNPRSFRKFGELCGGSGSGGSDYLSQLKGAIGAYIAAAYHDDTGDSYDISEAYNLLNFEPEAMDDDWQPDYGEYGDYDPYAYEDDDY